MILTRRTLLTGLQFALLFALLAQFVLAALYSVFIFDIFSSVVTRKQLDNWAWMASIYPGFMEQRSLYWIAASLLMASIAVIALLKMNTLSFIRAMASKRVSPGEQTLFLTGFTVILLVSTLFLAKWNAFFTSQHSEMGLLYPLLSVIGFIHYYITDGEYFLPLYLSNHPYEAKALAVLCKAFLLALLLFLSLFWISSRQWRNIRGKKTSGAFKRLLYSLLFSAIPVLTVISAYIILCHFVPGSKWLWLWREYAGFIQSYKAIAIIFTLLLTLGGFIMGYIISISAYQEPSAASSTRRGEALTFATIMVAILAFAVMGGVILRKHYHFFTSPVSFFSLEKIIPHPRKVIIFGSDGDFKDVNMWEQGTCFTPDNMERIRSYLIHTNHQTRYTRYAYSRLLDYHTLNWDLSGALEIEAQRIRELQANQGFADCSLWVLQRSRMNPELKSFVDFYADQHIFAYPGFDSCVRMAFVLYKYGETKKAEEFFNMARTKPNARERLGDPQLKCPSIPGLPEKMRGTGKAEGSIRGTVLYRGNPLPGVKVRIFPVSQMSPRGKEKLVPYEYVVRQIGYERDMLLNSLYRFSNVTQPADYVRLYNIFAVAIADESGCFSFDNLESDEYYVTLMLEGEAANYEPATNPGIASVTEEESNVTLQAIRLE